MQNPTHHLPLNLETFGFVEREKYKGKSLPNQCGRDFLYYCLTYYRPELHNSSVGNPEQIREKRIFGYKLHPSITAGMYGFVYAIAYLKSLNLSIEINGKTLRSFPDFVRSMLFFVPMKYDDAISRVESCVDSGVACGIDLSAGFGGLLSHVMFVYGYDDSFLYVFDTHKIGQLGYEKITPENDPRFIMKISRNETRQRWTRFNHVWIVRQN